MKNALYFLIGEAVPKILALLALPFFSFYLLPEEYGIRGYFLSLQMILIIIGSLSFNTYYIKIYFQSSSEKKKDTILSFHHIFNILLLIVFIIGGRLIVDDSNSSISFKPFVIYTGLIAYLESLYIYPLLELRLKQNAKTFAFILILRSLLQYAIIFVLLDKFTLGLEGMYLGIILGYLLAIPAIYKYRRKFIFKIDIISLLTIVKFTLPLLFSALSIGLLASMDKILLERFINLEDLGIYTMAGALSLIVNVVFQAMYKYIEPLIFKTTQTITIQKQFFDGYAIIAVICTLGISMFSKEIFEIFIDPKFSEGGRLVKIVIIPIFISGLNLFFFNYLIKDNRQIILATINISAVVLSLLLSLVLGPSYGVKGIVFSFSLSNLIAIFYLLRICKFQISRNIPYILTLPLLLTFDYSASLLPESIVLRIALYFSCSISLISIHYKKFKKIF